jgi:hypothetical protein
VPCPVLGLLDSGDFSMTTLSYQRGEWGKHFTTSCPKILIGLDHVQEPMEVFDLFWWCNYEYRLYFLRCGSMPVLVRIFLRYFISAVQNFDLGH